MSFGRRTGLPSNSMSKVGTKPRRRRGGYPLAVLTVGVVCYLCALVLTMIPYFNPTGRSIAEIASSSIVAVLNVALVAALIMGLIDIVFRFLNFSSVLAYAGASGVLTFAFCFWVGSILGSGSSANFPAFVAMMVLVPAGAGGAVLGMFRP